MHNDVYNALQLPSSKAHGDAKLFSPESLLGAPKAAVWVLDPEGDHQALVAHSDNSGRRLEGISQRREREKQRQSLK